MNNQMLTAALARFVAQREEAKAVLLTYFTNSVGTGDHGGFLNDVAHWTKQLAEAEGCLATLQRSFVPPAEESAGSDTPQSDD